MSRFNLFSRRPPEPPPSPLSHTVRGAMSHQDPRQPWNSAWASRHPWLMLTFLAHARLADLHPMRRVWFKCAAMAVVGFGVAIWASLPFLGALGGVVIAVVLLSQVIPVRALATVTMKSIDQHHHNFDDHINAWFCKRERAWYQRQLPAAPITSVKRPRL